MKKQGPAKRKSPAMAPTTLGPLVCTRLSDSESLLQLPLDLLLSFNVDVLPCHFCERADGAMESMRCSRCGAREHVSCTLRRGIPLFVAVSPDPWFCHACRDSSETCNRYAHLSHLKAVIPIPENK